MTTNTGPRVKQDPPQREGGGAAFCQSVSFQPGSMEAQRLPAILTTEGRRGHFIFCNPKLNLLSSIILGSAVNQNII